MTSTPYRTISRGSPASSRGFTLIEIMIVVAIIAVLAAIALPQYRDYVLRGQLVEASTELSAMRAGMERYYQDNRTYANVSATLRAPCDSADATLRTFKYFTLTCTGARDPERYTLLATGRPGPTFGFEFTVNQAGRQTTPEVGSPGWGTRGAQCWILSRGQACN